MKKMLTLSLLVFIVATGYAQTHKKEITKRLSHYGDVVRSKDIDSLLSFMYPRFFDVFPKDALTDGMKKTFSDTSMTITFGAVDIQSISDVFVNEKVKFVMVEYSMVMDIGFTNNDAATVGMMKTAYSQMYGEKNVSFNDKTNLFTIKANNKMFAIQDEAFGKNWWLIEKKDEMRSYVSGFIPDAVWEHYK